MSADLYSDAFFADVERTAAGSARRVVPVAVREWRPAHVVDVGCGEGIWAAAFEALGVPALGIDGDYVRPGRRLIRRFLPWDLATPLPDLGRFDLCVCLEVAEHLPEAAADGLVESLVGLSDRILFSAAVPGQGGTGHLNEQPHSYWLERFDRHGFAADTSWRDRFAEQGEVAWWYQRNMVVLDRRVPRPPAPPRLDAGADAPAGKGLADLAATADLASRLRRDERWGHRLVAGPVGRMWTSQAAFDAAVVAALEDVQARLRALEFAVRDVHGPLLGED
jgi:SAM-dependent methyltransferase